MNTSLWQGLAATTSRAIPGAGRALTIVLVATAGCRGLPAPGPQQWPPGFIVIAERARAAWGIPRDTVPERHIANVPPAVVSAAEQMVRDAEAGGIDTYDPLCSRYFASDATVIVLYRYTCHRADVRLRDRAIAIGALSTSGEVIGQGLHHDWGTWFVGVEPLYRPPWDSAAAGMREVHQHRQQR